LRVRKEMDERLPALTRRIHRSFHTPIPTLDDGTTPSAPEDKVDWSWTDAERRLTDAYERDGLGGWARTAMREMEAEGAVERARRGHS
jgi:hypothetical protein